MIDGSTQYGRDESEAVGFIKLEKGVVGTKIILCEEIDDWCTCNLQNR